MSETFFRPWEGVAGLAELQGAVEKRLRRTPPRRAFFYLDYMQPSFRRSDGEITEGVDQEAVYYSYCAAALWGREAFCSGWHAGGEYRGPLYFADLGRPLGDRPVETGGLVLREYERGLVCLLARPEAAEVTWTLSRPTATLYDLFAGGALPVAEGRVTVRLAPCQREASSTLTPIGRVYLKVTGDRTATAGRTGWAG